MLKKNIIIPESYNYIGVFLAMRCNLKCSFCLNSLDNSFNRGNFRELSGEEWVDSLNQIILNKKIPITFCGGEPFLHKDFLYIINNLKRDLDIDILTNLQWGERGIERFISEVDPNRLKRDAPYASIRVSYHPEQMGDGKSLVKNVKKLKDLGFSIGVWSVQYPDPKTLELITQMQFNCKEAGIDFRLKDFTGKFEGIDDNGKNFSITYGNYSRYPQSTFQEETKRCFCKTSEFLIGPNGNNYKCHRDLYAGEFPVGNILDDKFKLAETFNKCFKYGHCHPCDVKVKTNYKQISGYTSVEIINVSK